MESAVEATFEAKIENLETGQKRLEEECNQIRAGHKRIESDCSEQEERIKCLETENSLLKEQLQEQQEKFENAISKLTTQFEGLQKSIELRREDEMKALKEELNAIFEGYIRGDSDLEETKELVRDLCERNKEVLRGADLEQFMKSEHKQSSVMKNFELLPSKMEWDQEIVQGIIRSSKNLQEAQPIVATAEHPSG